MRYKFDRIHNLVHQPHQVSTVRSIDQYFDIASRKHAFPGVAQNLKHKTYEYTKECLVKYQHFQNEQQNKKTN